MRPCITFTGIAFVATLLAVIPPSVVRSAAPIKERVTLPLVRGGQVKVSDFWQEDGAVIDEDRLVIVGTVKRDFESDDPNKYDRSKLDPNGALVDLSKKTALKFTNGHKAGIFSVSVSKSRVATAGNQRDPVLRIWDLKTNKTVATVEIGKTDEWEPDYEAAWFHKGVRVAIVSGKQLTVFDPNKPNERTEYPYPQEAVGWLHRPVISMDDKWIACEKEECGLVVWDVTTKKATVVSLKPEKADEDEQWSTHGAAFGPKGTLIAWRNGPTEVPDGKTEADVPADRRAVVRIDNGKVVPLGMGISVYTLNCALDPTETWLAVVGSARSDKKPEETTGELRVYHLPTKELAFREQVPNLPLTWVAFTPSGKRIVAAHGAEGIVRWWDVQEKK